MRPPILASLLPTRRYAHGSDWSLSCTVAALPNLQPCTGDTHRSRLEANRYRCCCWSQEPLQHRRCRRAYRIDAQAM